MPMIFGEWKYNGWLIGARTMAMVGTFLLLATSITFAFDVFDSYVLAMNTFIRWLAFVATLYLGSIALHVAHMFAEDETGQEVWSEINER